MNDNLSEFLLVPRDVDLVLFDLDGVLTKTAQVHAAAWKRLFDDFLERRSQQTGEPFEPFDIETDYLVHVDGKPRSEGAEAFLASRGIVLPPGTPEDGPEVETIAALGRAKDEHFSRMLEQLGVAIYDSSLALVRQLREHDVKTAVVSSSRHCKAVLEAAGIAGLFDVRVDGNDLGNGKLRGKPAPDSFLEAARRLGIPPSRAVVVEDATAGVAAGRAARFAHVIGVDRGGQAQALRDAGADVVVDDLAQIKLVEDPPSAWSLSFDGFDPDQEGIRESLCTLGNGFFATRGATVDAVADDIHYPGTYLAGGYNRLRTEFPDRIVETEDLVNFPNWLPISLRIGDGPWFSTSSTKLLEYHQQLDLRAGLLLRRLRFEDEQGRRSSLVERRLVSMDAMHVAAVELSLTAENWSGEVGFCSAIDARVVNAGARLYRRFNKQHLQPLQAEVVDDDSVLQLVTTSQSKLRVAQVARTRVWLDDKQLQPQRRTVDKPGLIGQAFEVALRSGETVVIEKVQSLYTSRDHAIAECTLAARTAAARAGRFADLAAAQQLAWKHLWRRFEVHLQPAGAGFGINAPMLLRLNMFHLLQAVAPNSIGLDIGVPARGWTGEAYQGHIFWDELFIFPFFNFRLPEITRSLLMYRHRRLGEARAAAAAAGYRGAMFPWQSGSDGQEETHQMNLNPRSQRWMPDNTWLQRHVNSAIAYNVWQYFQVSRDVEFLHSYGAELILDIASFWASIARFDDTLGRYVIRGVMGPDEFHDAYPGASNAGIDNNAYTNVMAVWVLCRAIEVLDLLSALRRSELMALLGLTDTDIERWSDISRRMFVPFHDDGIISQFEGYEKLLEFDWQAYRNRHGNIQRLDLILEQEHDSANRYKLSKQADVLMLFYLFSAEELHQLFERLDYPFEYETIPRNVAYYTARTSHGSTLSRVVHAWVLARSDRPRAMRYFAEALQSDVSDIQQGTAAEGVHLGAMAGTVDLMQRVTTGIEIRADVLHLNPQLPQEVRRLDMRIRYRGHSLDLRVMHESLTVRSRDHDAPPFVLDVGGKVCDFPAGTTRVFHIDPASGHVIEADTDD
ncbi:beta-phosphoglucomutase family hydrolase [Piscinibacter sakaiensis]|uniref:beta-phosphoglucomutase family hydrolase n=1 Tax=Piscinibacter sakaiensis TaxID=1547922 RepID=UPI003AAB861D